MPVEPLNIRRFLPGPRAVWRAIGGGLLLLWLPVFALAQTLTVEMARGPLEDRRLREAILASTDWMRAAEDTGLDVRSVILRHADETTSTQATPQDVEKAKFLLLEMGGVSGQTPLILLFDAQRTEKLAQLVASNLRQLQLPVNLVALPEDARAEMQAMMRSRTDLSTAEPGFIMLTWTFAEAIGPVQPAPRSPEIVRPERPAPDPVVPARLPDLIVSQFDATYDPGARMLTVRALVRNIGQGEASARFAVTFPESTGVIGDGLGRHAAGPLAPDGSQWVEARMRIDDAMRGKTVRLRTLADAAQTVHETNERNNASIERSVQLGRPEPPPPDLIIERLDPVYERAARRLTIRVAVRNVGEEQAGSSLLQIVETQMRFAVPAVSIPAIAPGGSAVGVAEVTVPETAVGEVAVLEAMANSNKKLREADLGNNGFGPVRVMLEPAPEPEQPDLQLRRLIAEHVAARNRVVLRAVVVNAGPVPSAATRVRFSELQGQVPDVDLSLQALAPGQQIILHSEEPLAPSPEERVLEFMARADVDARVDESREDNNESQVARLRIPATPVPLPDLAIASLAAVQARTGAPLEVTAAIVNGGGSGSDATEFVLHVAGADRVVGSLPALGRGEKHELRLEVPVQARLFAGMVDVSLEVDPEERIAETTRANNLRRQQVELRPPVWPWVGAGVAALLLMFRLFRRGGGGQPEPQAKIPPNPIGLRPRAHAGRQSAQPEPGTPGIAFEFSLRPVRDSGRVTVERLADTGEPET